MFSGIEGAYMDIYSMRETIFWVLLVMTLWAPLFTASYFIYGLGEKRLQQEIEELRGSSNWGVCSYGFVLWVFLDLTNRWIISLVGAVLLFMLKLMGGL
jgi:hypothetical protein